jgi:hypothetical protein
VNAASLCSASASKPVAIKQAMQPRSPAEVVSMGEPQISQTRALLAMGDIYDFLLCADVIA